MSLIGLHSHRETGLVGSASHEASPVALEKSLACARSFGEDDSSAQVTPSPPRLVAGRGQCIARTTPASPAVYRCEGWGPHLGDCTTKGIWSQPESMLHINFLELKAVFLARLFLSLTLPALSHLRPRLQPPQHSSQVAPAKHPTLVLSGPTTTPPLYD